MCLLHDFFCDMLLYYSIPMFLHTGVRQLFTRLFIARVIVSALLGGLALSLLSILYNVRVQPEGLVLRDEIYTQYGFPWFFYKKFADATAVWDWKLFSTTVFFWTCCVIILELFFFVILTFYFKKQKKNMKNAGK